MDHEELQALVVRLRLGTSASELHGSLTGYLAGGGAVGGDALLGVLELDGEATEPTAADRAELDALARQSQAALVDAELGFEPLLPADDRPLHERADAGWNGAAAFSAASAWPAPPSRRRCRARRRRYCATWARSPAPRSISATRARTRTR